MTTDFIKLAKEQIEAKQLEKALLTCLQGLSSSAGNQQGQILLARVFFELGFITFATREVFELCQKFPKSVSLKNLLHKLDPSVAHPIDLAGKASSAAENVLAEADFEVEFIEDDDQD